MQVCLRQVPSHLSDDSVRSELEAYTKALGILDWHCQKSRNKSYAFITFLSEADGEKFLKRHGQTSAAPLPKGAGQASSPFKSQPKAIARLRILKTDILVAKGNKPADQMMMRHLEYQKEQRKPVDVDDSNTKNPPIGTPIRHISCGTNMFVGDFDTLTFMEQTGMDVKGFARFGRRTLTLTLLQDYRVDIPYDIIQDLIAEGADGSLTLVLIETPRFYVRPAQLGFLQQPIKWERRTHLGLWPDHFKYVAHCLVYRIRLASHFMDTLQSLRSRDVIAVTRQYVPVQMPRKYEQDFTTCMAAFDNHVQYSGRIRSLPYAILFQLQGLIWNNYVHPAIALQMLEIMEIIAKDCKRDGVLLPFTTDSMKQLFQRIPYPCPGTEPRELLAEELVASVVEEEQKLRHEDPARTTHYGSKLPDRQTWVLKAMVTPTRIMLYGPDSENKNRVMRMFPDHSDYFIRVMFADEDGQDLPLISGVKNTAVTDRWRQIMKDGIRIADRKFEFLGFSHSSLRSHTAWFSAPFVDDKGVFQNNDTIIKSLGDFSDIRIAAKCAARIGQAFSETPYAVPILENGIDIEYIPDVKTADGKRVFSDGVGTISWDAVEEVWKHLPMASTASTCFQVRLGGIKGMLSLDSRLQGKVICVRKESMMKFPSDDQTTMGICDTASKPLRLFLNRQIIKILEDMGTHPGWFIAQQNKALLTLRNATTTASNTSAFLKSQLVGTNVGFPKLIRFLDRNGIDYRREKFMKSVVDHTILRELRLLKHKARIPVDMGVTLFGVMDETGFLDEGQIYATFDEEYDKIHGRVKGSLKDGLVLITRSPALHPGDIQFAHMRTPPPGHPLRDLQNCVVFSQKGSRDLPSQLSGGDLDGDLYNIFWDPNVMPTGCFLAADYPRVTPPSLDRVVTRDDIADFFITFMDNDILGLIANRHQILADLHEQGTRDADCLKLAEMHSTAVDYSKTGIPVKTQMPRSPHNMRPDFLAPAPPTQLYELGQISHIGDPEPDEDDEDGMGVTRHNYYKSEKILGELYRSVDEKRIWAHEIQRPVDNSGPSLWDQLNEHVQAALEEERYTVEDVDYTRRIEAAWKIRDLYESAVANNMWQFSDNPRAPISEVEAFCGSIMNRKGSQTRRQRDSSIKLKEEMDGLMNFIVKLIRDRSGGATGYANDASSVVTEEEGNTERERINALELSWACVIVGCGKSRKQKRRYYGGEKPLESFRVVAASCLVKDLDQLLTRKRIGRAGGYVGVNGRRYRQHKTLPLR
ncbi:RNA-dependent RNA polymerase [Trichoderma arundinaceum]|uniref:RNA-dependent RNA polymerase n=1 Tax=Trichoderma arundinaceum TaxID=490622 RepID=A0A395NVZ4_TRIAR|nr:RNA-dependent RNA polymerase [Trichoderma arundinaceum]